ncbi:hypothetical protein CSC62_08805 [Pseudoxanthomonas jiangsuensis]|uniref:hypothetical protein n=1 Tax=Pseudoxanthomonas jiangsuensis TaxID=619688 RepID=UPI00139108AF|nr:hypothetical protein [Pseudoxanthomonas jiangsuensis]KAF1697290.1 hypothetical protein CSC62_08805 [Pseudoxanthomonas jiangsuensis]
MTTAALPLDLYKANIELQLRLTRLLQDSGRQWLDAIQHTTEEGIAETTAEIEGLLRTSNWQSLATLPNEAFWRLFQQRSGDVQLVNQIALKNQTSFTTGMQQALETWQKSVASAVGSAGNAQPLQDMLNQWGTAWANTVQPAPAKAAAKKA